MDAELNWTSTSQSFFGEEKIHIKTEIAVTNAILYGKRHLQSSNLFIKTNYFRGDTMKLFDLCTGEYDCDDGHQNQKPPTRRWRTTKSAGIPVPKRREAARIGTQHLYFYSLNTKRQRTKDNICITRSNAAKMPGWKTPTIDLNRLSRSRQSRVTFSP